MIEGRIVKGFRDFLPDAEEKRLAQITLLQEVFQHHAYRPIDTPVLEYAETLLGKSGGETEKQIFRFTDNGGRDVALRFDLTVPFARYLSMHKEELGLPFKRYHIAKVWRGENPQKGRYREFIQCDFDNVGNDSLQSDFDILLTILSAFKAMNINEMTIHINHRAVFNQFLDKHQVMQHSVEVLRTVDKLTKIGREKVLDQLTALIGAETALLLLDFIQTEASYSDTLAKMEKLSGTSEAIDRLRALGQLLEELDLMPYFVLNPSITRGLDYYTGLVFETFLNKLPSIGSVCSGGRYDNLVGLYSKDPISGVGGSIGLDRLMAALEELNLEPGQKIPLKVIVFHSDYMAQANKLALALRSESIITEIYPVNRKYDAQFKYAERRGAHYAVFVQEESYTLRSLADRTQQEELDLISVVNYLKVK